MPYIAFDLDALKHVPDGARAAGIAEAAYGYGLVRLWAYCWTEKTETVSETHLRGFFGGGAVGPALVAFGHLELNPAGYRVRGAEKYLRVSEARARGGRAAKANLVPGFHPKSSREGAGGPAGGPAGAQPVVSTGSTPALTPTPDTRHPTPDTRIAIAAPVWKMPADWRASPEDFFRRAQVERIQAGLISEKMPRHLSTWWSSALLELNGDVERLWAALEAFCRDPYWKTKTPPLPFPAFMSEWPKYAPRKPA